jgi:hypothetical protein
MFYYIAVQFYKPNLIVMKKLFTLLLASLCVLVHSFASPKADKTISNEKSEKVVLKKAVKETVYIHLEVDTKASYKREFASKPAIKPKTRQTIKAPIDVAASFVMNRQEYIILVEKDNTTNTNLINVLFYLDSKPIPNSNWAKETKTA